MSGRFGGPEEFRRFEGQKVVDEEDARAAFARSSQWEAASTPSGNRDTLKYAPPSTRNRSGLSRKHLLWRRIQASASAYRPLRGAETRGAGAEVARAPKRRPIGAILLRVFLLPLAPRMSVSASRAVVAGTTCGPHGMVTSAVPSAPPLSVGRERVVDPVDAVLAFARNPVTSRVTP